MPIPRRHWTIVAAAIALLAIGGLSWLILRRASAPESATSQQSLVVLPAKVMSDSPGGQLVGDGLVETLSVRLNEVPGIQVVTPSAAVAASDKNADPFGAARSVGANLVVRSSVVRNGERVRIIYSVWNVQTRFQVAGGTVDGTAADLFGMQDQLAQSVADALKLRRRSTKPPTPSGLDTARDQERYLQAIGYLQRYDQQASLDAAIQLLETLSKERPDSPLVQAALARAYLDKLSITRDPSWAEKASAASSRAQSLNPGLPDVDVTLGALRVETGRPADGIAVLQQALSSQPNNFEALLWLARAYGDSGRPAEAESTYRRAIQLQPSYWGGYSKLAGFYFSRGDYPAAAEMFRRVTRLSPDNARALANLGGTYQLMGEFDQALSAYKRSLELEPTNIAYSNLGTTQFFLGHYEDAAEAFESAVKLSPDYYQLWANLGDAYRWAKNLQGKAPAAYEKAISLCRGELRLNSKSAMVHSYMALCLAKTGRLDEAQEHVREALSGGEKNPEILYNAAIVANLNHRPQEALKWLQAASRAGYPAAFIDREPEFASLRNEKMFQEITHRVKRENI